MFKRRNADPIAAAETEVAELRARRGKLAAQLAGVETELTQAISDRRRHLVEEDVDHDSTMHPRDLVFGSRDRRDGLADAITELDQRIIDAEANLAEARDRLAREAAAKELNALADALDTAVGKFRDASNAMTAALVPVAAITPHATTELSSGLASLTRDAAIAVQELAAMARNHSAAIVNGSGAIRHPPAPPPPEPPALPDVPRQAIFVRANSSWHEPDGTIATAGAHTSPNVPVEVARAALKNNSAVLPQSEIAAKLLQIESPEWCAPRPDTCIDLATGRRPKPPPEHAAGRVMHSGEGVVGTAFLAR